MPGIVVGVNDDYSWGAPRDERSECGFPRPAPAVASRMSDTGTITHSVVEHLPLTATHLQNAAFGRVARCGDEPSWSRRK
jgi:hypothetical protein